MRQRRRAQALSLRSAAGAREAEMAQAHFLPPPSRKPNRRIRVSLPVEHWPIPDQRTWMALFATGDLFDDGGPGAHLAGRSRTALANAYGRWLGFLARTEPSALDQNLAVRVTRERITAFAQHLAETSRGTSVASQLHHLRNALRFLASEQDWAWLLTIAKRIEAKAEPRPKRDRLRTSEELFRLGNQLMHEAEATL